MPEPIDHGQWRLYIKKEIPFACDFGELLYNALKLALAMKMLCEDGSRTHRFFVVPSAKSVTPFQLINASISYTKSIDWHARRL